MNSRLKIIPFLNPSGASIFRVSGTTLTGEQIRRNFPTWVKANQFLSDVESTATPAKGTTQASAPHMNLTELDRESLLAVLQGLISQAKPLAPPAAPAPVVPPSPTVETARTDFLSAKTTKRLRDRTLAEYRSRLGLLRKNHGASPVATITREHLEPIIFKPGQAACTTNGNRRVLCNFFAWCKKKKFITANPVEDIDPVAEDEREPEIFTVEQVRSLLRAAQGFKKGRLVPYVALGFFAGLRPKELARLEWGVHISLHKQMIRVTSDVAKKRAKRAIEVTEPLLSWLKVCDGKPVVGKNWRQDMDRVRRLAGFKSSYVRRIDKPLLPWPKDGIRHTALSMHFRKFKDECETAYWAGNSPDMLHARYKGMVTDAEADEFWGLLPGTL